MSVTAIVIDGVLRSSFDSAPSPVGRTLYKAMAETASVALIADEGRADRLNQWLLLNGFDRHSYLITRLPEDPEDAAQRRVAQMKRLRANTSVDMLLEANPSAAKDVLLLGIPVMLVMYPLYSRPEFQPDYAGAVRSWESLVEEMDTQQQKRVSDKRIDPEIL